MRIAGILMLAVIFPACAHAEVLINEIMYDLPDSDTGREWVEITNTGASPVDVSGYKFFEANTNHALALISGDGVLPAGSAAVITDDPAKFKLDWPGYSGTLFDSSFSLSNTGESLALKDAALTVLHSVVYGSAMGAAGDGNALHLNGDTFISAAPTFSAFAGTSASAGGTSTTTPAAPASSSGSGGPPPEYIPIPTLRIITSGARTVSSGADTEFTAVVYDGKGNRRDTALVTWSFGDGMRRTGASVYHKYYEPGEYLAVVHVTTPDGGDARSEMVVTVKNAGIRIISVSPRGVTLANSDSRTLDISLWRLSAGGAEFRIPEDTQILAGKSVLFPLQVIGLPLGGSASLLYPSGEVAASFPETRVSFAPAAPANGQPFAPVTSFNTVQKVNRITSTNENIQAHEDAVVAPTARAELAAVGAVAAAEAPLAGTQAGILRSPWTLGLLGVILLAGSAFILL